MPNSNSVMPGSPRFSKGTIVVEDERGLDHDMAIKLQDAVIERREQLARAFRGADPASTGRMLVTDFKKALYFAAGIPMAMVDAVITRVEVSNGYVDYVAWIDSCTTTVSSPEKTMSFEAKSPADVDAEVQEIISTAAGELSICFEDRDPGGTEMLSWDDFQYAVTSVLTGWRLQHSHREVLFRCLERGAPVRYTSWLQEQAPGFQREESPPEIA